MKIVILAAGIGSRLGNPYPKPLTKLNSGKRIMQQQVENLELYFDKQDIMVVVGFKKDLVMEEYPDLTFIYNPEFDRTNTSKSLLRALYKCIGDDVLWLNGDVVFDAAILEKLNKYINDKQSFVAVNNSSVGEEEVKYTLNSDGFIDEISKIVKTPLGEAVGINYIASQDISSFISSLENCNDQDYFERGLELSIEKDAIQILPVDISDYRCIEVDFKEDLDNANSMF